MRRKKFDLNAIRVAMNGAWIIQSVRKEGDSFIAQMQSGKIADFVIDYEIKESLSYYPVGGIVTIIWSQGRAKIEEK